MKEQKKKILGILLTLIGGIFWGLSGACGQYLFQYKDASARWLVPIRLVIAGFIMLVYFLAKDRKTTFLVWKAKRNAIDIMVYGLAGMMMCQYTYFATIELSNAGTATVLQYVAPGAIILFGTILSFSFYMMGVKLIGPIHASLYACIEPVAAAILSSVWLKVPFTLIDVIGFGFIISTIFILTLSGKENVKAIEIDKAA